MQISYDGVVVICDYLNDNFLKEIDISVNTIGNEGVQRLADALKGNTSLTQLNIFRNKRSSGFG